MVTRYTAELVQNFLKSRRFTHGDWNGIKFVAYCEEYPFGDIITQDSEWPEIERQLKLQVYGLPTGVVIRFEAEP